MSKYNHGILPHENMDQLYDILSIFIVLHGNILYSAVSNLKNRHHESDKTTTYFVSGGNNFTHLL